MGINHNKKIKPPLQFKRGTARAFLTVDPVLLDGQPAFELDTMKLKIGDGYHRYSMLPYIGDGKDGKSAYQIWLDEGHEGSVDDFLDSLIGPDGKSTYEIWLSLGHEGSLEDFIEDMKGDDGDSAYEVWVKEGYEGTVEDFLIFLQGEYSYELFKKLYPEYAHITEEEYEDLMRARLWTDIPEPNDSSL